MQTGIGIGIDFIEKKLKNLLSEERFLHCKQVSKMAGEIAEHHNESVQKAVITGLIHDVAKDLSCIDLNRMIKKYNIKLSSIEKKIPEIWHAYIGAEMLKDLFNINDEQIVNAIKYHSTASETLGELGKIIYIADKIEPNRNFPEAEKIRNLVWYNIDSAMLEILNRELTYLLSKNRVIHPDTLKTRNKLLIKTRDCYGQKRFAQKKKNS